jgi:hypothetical protein
MMNKLHQTAVLATLLGACAAAGAQEAAKPAAAAPETEPKWEFGITAFPTDVRGGPNYTSGTFTADRGPLRFEARVNYEGVGVRSAFVGWTFSGGEEVTWEIRPLIGGTWGDMKALVPALEASVAYKRVDFYIEAEYVHPKDDKQSSYLYAWSELGFKPTEWLRVGLAAQRTRAYGGDRDIQRGPFAQVSFGHFTVGGFWFNPGSDDQVFVASIGVAF